MRSVPVAVGHFAGAVALWAVWLSMLFLARSVERAELRTPGQPPRGARLAPEVSR
jgi:hypothetical protein